jgi:hypothetical protein
LISGEGKVGLAAVSIKSTKKVGLDDAHLGESAPVIAADASSQILTSISEFKGLIYVRYLDHVLYNRSMALAMTPQVRETIGWLVYECEQYITLTWDKDAGPPTLKGGDPKATGLVLLRSDIVEFKRLEDFLPLKICFEHSLNSQGTLLKNRVCASSHRSEKLPKTSRKGVTEQ